MRSRSRVHRGRSCDGDFIWTLSAKWHGQRYLLGTTQTPKLRQRLVEGFGFGVVLSRLRGTSTPRRWPPRSRARTASNDADIRPSLVRLGAQNGPQRRPFRAVPRRLPQQPDSLPERGEFEPSRPGLRTRSALVEREPNSIRSAASAGSADSPAASPRRRRQHPSDRGRTLVILGRLLVLVPRQRVFAQVSGRSTENGRVLPLCGKHQRASDCTK